MIAGHLQQKNGYWYMVISYSDEMGKRIYKWKATHLKKKGNKKQAEKMLMYYRREFSASLQLRRRANGIYFDAYLDNWLKELKAKLAPSTFSSYSYNIRSSASPYFKQQNLLLTEVEPRHISKYYKVLFDRGLSSTSVHRYHANLRKALQDAVTEGLIPNNPADRVDVPGNRPYTASFYSAEESRALLSALHGTELKVPVTLTLLLGLRRSELLGLKWDAVDFDLHVVHIRRSVQEINGSIVERDILKRKSSHRTLPIPTAAEEMLLSIRQTDGFICIDTFGKVIRPNDLTRRFKKLLQFNNLPVIRFHDLRHTCAALLLTAQTPMIEVSHWLGHSTLAITADLYGHLEFASKIQCASVLTDALKLGGNENDGI